MHTKAFDVHTKGAGPEDLVSSAKAPTTATARISTATFMIFSGFKVLTYIKNNFWNRILHEANGSYEGTKVAKINVSIEPDNRLA